MCLNGFRQVVYIAVLLVCTACTTFLPASGPSYSELSNEQHNSAEEGASQFLPSSGPSYSEVMVNNTPMSVGVSADDLGANSSSNLSVVNAEAKRSVDVVQPVDVVQTVDKVHADVPQNKVRVLDVAQLGFEPATSPWDLGSDANKRVFSKGKPSLTLGAGDSVQISIWEAPPAVLFGSAGVGASDLSIGVSGAALGLPEQIISQNGTLVVPFVGEVRAAGRTLNQVEALIRQGLSKIANQPQVMARLVQNATNSVTVIADGRSQKMPLTAKGERLLDVLPLVSDIKKIKNSSLLLQRGRERLIVPITLLSESPQVDLFLQPYDVVTVLQEPYSTTVLGASNNNAVLNFGDEGLSVTEAIGRVSGLNDYRANPAGVFVFRQADNVQKLFVTASGEKVDNAANPVIYRVDLTQAEGVLLAQKFKLQDKDTLFIANSSSVGLQKFLSLIGSIVSPAAAVKSVGN